ncbi:hypothetical protein TNCV_4401581 [Trichonephila clavipes]|nr:hypothetical protein TNCV_4401581 [Trichonephila clavipes]
MATDLTAVKILILILVWQFIKTIFKQGVLRFVEYYLKRGRCQRFVPRFHKQFLFSIEAHFWLNGYVNKTKLLPCIWSEANPQVTATATAQMESNLDVQFSMTFSNIRGRISAITRRMLSSKWSSVCGLSGHSPMTLHSPQKNSQRC